MPTTVQVSNKTKRRLDEEKSHPRETYDEVIQELLTEHEMNLKKKIDRAKRQEDIPHEKVKEMLGL